MWNVGLTQARPKIYIDKFHNKLVYVGLAQVHPNYSQPGKYYPEVTVESLITFVTPHVLY